MMKLSAALRQKPSWWLKFRDTAVVDRWRKNALEQAQYMKESHVEYVLRELDGFDALRDDETGAEVCRRS
jgi:hypothetical protein